MPPKYDLEKIKFSTDKPTFEKAVALYEGGRVIGDGSLLLDKLVIIQ